jgi:sucrose phosphorylase
MLQKRKFVKTTETVHKQEPNFTRPMLEIPKEIREQLQAKLKFLYGDEIASKYLPELERILKVYWAHKSEKRIELEREFDPEERFTEEDVLLITYGDLLRSKDKNPINTLADFCNDYLRGTINTIHLLPFYPYTSDRGFSITDFESVDSNLGTWQDIEDLEHRYQIMVDGVINHVSSKNRWFQEFLNGNPKYKDFFISYDSYDDLPPEERKIIFRPRTSDVLTKFDNIYSPKYVWTTFSPDQIDLNYKNPEVLMNMIEVLLLYVRHGADIIRLDAATYLWDVPGTPCVHLEETHTTLKLFRTILDFVAPTVAIITEINAPHEINMSYFGKGIDESHILYNFALPPLVLHTFYTENSTDLTKWASGLEKISNTCHLLNILDCHDGIGLIPADGILINEEIENIARKVEEYGGYVSYQLVQDKIKKAYEANITWYSALNDESSGESIDLEIKRFIASRCIALALQGIPGIYFHGLFGTKNDIEGVMASRSRRAINRRVFDSDLILRKELDDPNSRVARINKEFGRYLSKRVKHRAFHPNGKQKILNISPNVFSLLRVSPENDEHILCLINITHRRCVIEILLYDLNIESSHWYDIVNKIEWKSDRGKLTIELAPYDVIWLKPFRELTL